MNSIVEDLVRDEGIELKPYRCPAGRLTIGVGRNLDDVGLTKREALYLLAQDLARTEEQLDRLLPWWRSLSEARQRALVNMGFNLGIKRLLGFHDMLAALEAGEWERAAASALDSQWARQVGARAERIARLLREG
jgi:lysozyme